MLQGHSWLREGTTPEQPTSVVLVHEVHSGGPKQFFRSFGFLDAHRVQAGVDAEGVFIFRPTPLPFPAPDPALAWSTQFSLPVCRILIL